jgi:hypothetical protein
LAPGRRERRNRRKFRRGGDNGGRDIRSKPAHGMAQTGARMNFKPRPAETPR